jgi:hypothetical protein
MTQLLRRARLARGNRRIPASSFYQLFLCLVFVTFLLLASFSRASGVNGASILADPADNYVTNRFLQQLTASSSASTVNGITIYRPLSNTNLVPQRLITPALLADPNFFSLVSQSIPAADPNASSDTTTLPALNGFSITPAFWDAPALTGTASGGFAASASLPAWIYVTATSVGGSALQSGTATIGRFAYHVYNIGGLLNANVAGYPSSFTAAGGQVGTLKATAAGADLTQLGIPQSAVDNLIAFRNPQATGANYLDLVSALASGGFLSSTATDSVGVTYTNNFFPTRQSLLSYASQSNPALLPALPYLTTFSLSANTPSWMAADSPSWPATGLSGSSTGALTVSGSGTPANQDLLSVRYAGPTAATFTHYDDNGSASTYTENPGAPLIQRRFSLAKLPWITHAGPGTNSTGATISAAAVQACFGLAWNPNATGPGGQFTSPRWEYTALSTGSSPNRILRLDEVAALTGTAAREPNFFELLKAGILWGSLGRDPGPQNGGLIVNTSAL